MKKKCVLLSGPTVVSHEELKKSIQKSAVVLTNSDHSSIESIIKKQQVDLILLEMQTESESNIKLIKHLKNHFPEIAIIVIDDDQEKLAEAFNCGVKDAFRKPFDPFLLAERVEALIKRSIENHQRQRGK